MDSLQLTRREMVQRAGKWTCLSIFVSGSVKSQVSAYYQESSPPERLPRENLLLYRDGDAVVQRVDSVEKWGQRRAEIVRGMEAVMGKLPGDEKRCPLELRIEDEIDLETHIQRLISYQSEPGSRVPAYLSIPKVVLAGKKRAPGVLCLHGTNNIVGHGVVVGLGDKPNRSHALELAQRGYVTLAPNYPLLAKYQDDPSKFGWESGTLKAVWDNIRGLDLLESMPFVDSSRGFGAIGHSLGGHNSVFTAVFEPRLRVIISSCGLDSFLDYYQGNEKNWYPDKGWCQNRYMPKLAAYRGKLDEIPFDFHELIGALAPRATLIVAPTRDSNFRYESVDRIATAAKAVYQLYGAAEQLRVEHPDCDHDFPIEMRSKAYALLDRELVL